MYACARHDKSGADSECPVCAVERNTCAAFVFGPPPYAVGNPCAAPMPPSYAVPPGDPCFTCGQAMAVSCSQDYEPPQWVHSCSWCADPRTKKLHARLDAVERVVALVRSRNCCDGADAAHTHAMIHALGVLDDVTGEVSKGGLKDG